jgi:hypothetical protein
LVCRAATDVCDATENCTGAGAACPGDAVKPTSTICRASTDVCDPAEHCTGATKPCPSDALLPDGTSCSDGSSCTLGDTCDSGVCTGVVTPANCLDDFTCYKAKITPTTPLFSTVNGVTLLDQFENATASLSKPRYICPPANDNGGGVVDPNIHLVSYKIRQSPAHARVTNLLITNQLGDLHLDALRPDFVLVPTAKDLLAFPPPPPNSSHLVDHFKCYKVRVTSGTPRFATHVTVTMTDQFDSLPRLMSLKKPKHLCNPVDENGQLIKNPPVHLVCYSATPARGERKHVRRQGLYIANEFGQLRLDTLKEGEFCIPSTKTVTP